MSIRAAVPGDLGLVYNSWLKSFKGSWFSGPISGRRYYDTYRGTIDDLLKRPSVHLDCAVSGDEIEGWLCWEPANCHDHPPPGQRERRRDVCPSPAVFYAYVKEPCRRAGILTSLMRHAGVDPRAPFCFAFKTSATAKVICFPPDFKVQRPAWKGARFDPMFTRFAEGDSP